MRVENDDDERKFPYDLLRFGAEAEEVGRPLPSEASEVFRERIPDNLRVRGDGASSSSLWRCKWLSEKEPKAEEGNKDMIPKEDETRSSAPCLIDYPAALKLRDLLRGYLQQQLNEK